MLDTKGTRSSVVDPGDADGGIQRSPRPRGNFTTFRNEVLRDQRLSFRALGVLVEILSRPDNWRTRSESLAAGRSEGRDAVRTALAELRKAGYLVQHKVRGERGRIRTVSMVYDEPQVSVATAESPEPGKASSVSPEPGFPHVGQPVAGRPGALRKTETNDLEEDSSVARRLASSSSTAAPRDDDDEARKSEKQKIPRQPKPLTEAQRQAKIDGRKARERSAAITKITSRLDTDGEKAAVLCDHLAEEYSAGNLDRYVDAMDDADLEERLEEIGWQVDERREAARKTAEHYTAEFRRIYPMAPEKERATLADAIFTAASAGMSTDTIHEALCNAKLPKTARKIADYYVAALSARSVAA